MKDVPWSSLTCPAISYRIPDSDYQPIIEKECRNSLDFSFSLLRDVDDPDETASLEEKLGRLQDIHTASVRILERRKNTWTPKLQQLQYIIDQAKLYDEVATKRLDFLLEARLQEMEKRLIPLVLRFYASIEEEWSLASSLVQQQDQRLDRALIAARRALEENILSAYLSAESGGQVTLERLTLSHPEITQIVRNFEENEDVIDMVCPAETFNSLRVISVLKVHQSLLNARFEETRQKHGGPVEGLYCRMSGGSLPYVCVHGVGNRHLSKRDFNTLFMNHWRLAAPGATRRVRSHVVEMVSGSTPLELPLTFSRSPVFAEDIASSDKSAVPVRFFFVMYCKVIFGRTYVKPARGQRGDVRDGEATATSTSTGTDSNGNNGKNDGDAGGDTIPDGFQSVYDPVAGTYEVYDPTLILPQYFIKCAVHHEPPPSGPTPPEQDRMLNMNMKIVLPPEACPSVKNLFEYVNYPPGTYRPDHVDMALFPNTGPSPVAYPKPPPKTRPLSGRVASKKSTAATPGTKRPQSAQVRPKSARRERPSPRVDCPPGTGTGTPHDHWNGTDGSGPTEDPEDILWRHEGCIDLMRMQAHQIADEIRQKIAQQVGAEFEAMKDSCSRRVKREAELMHAARLKAYQWMQTETERQRRTLLREREKTRVLEQALDDLTRTRPFRTSFLSGGSGE